MTGSASGPFIRFVFQQQPFKFTLLAALSILTKRCFCWRQSGPATLSSASDTDNMTAGGDSTNNEEISGGGVANASLIGAAHGLLRPLILRRLKCDVLGGELPPKVGIFFS
jgi:hypothetical protein